MNYRRDIDGLRCLAVLPVILSHAGLPGFSGGFVGVDVFFVISGFLITQILISEMDQGTFSILRFYERRARRILPALFVVMVACLPFAWAWMMPEQMVEFGQSLVAVVVFASNILFWQQSGYFEAPADFKPLLHTWSLAVEEQYYLVFPLLLALIWPLGRRRVFWMIVFMAGVSLLLTEWGWRNKPVANFYLAPTRAWELLAGSIAAFLRPNGDAFTGRGWLGAVGLGMILLAIFTIDEKVPFPSLWTLLPVLGAVLVVLFAEPGALAARILSLPPVVGVGLISYSAYLWHQPILAFARLRAPTEPSSVTMAALALLSLGLAWATWAYVEQPFRRRGRSLLAKRRSLFAASALAGGAVAAIGSIAIFTQGLPTRLSAQAKLASEAGAPVYFVCGEAAACTLGDPAGTETHIAFMGDSHLGRYAWSLNELLNQRNLKARLVTQGYCAPLPGFSTDDLAKNSVLCRTIFAKAMSETLADPEITTIVLAAEWAFYTSGWRYTSTESVYDFVGDGVANETLEGNAAEFDRAFQATVQQIAASGKRLIVIESTPEYNMIVPTAVVRLLMLGEDLAPLAMARSEYEARNRDVTASFDAAGAAVERLRPQDGLCDATFCYPFDREGMPLFNDGNHLTARGLARLEPMLLSLIEP